MAASFIPRFKEIRALFQIWLELSGVEGGTLLTQKYNLIYLFLKTPIRYGEMCSFSRKNRLRVAIPGNKIPEA